jgi:hypothetical protein
LAPPATRPLLHLSLSRKKCKCSKAAIGESLDNGGGEMGVEPLVLSPAEMAVVFEHLLGPAGAAGGLLGDLDLRPPALDAARARLLERGVLRLAPDRANPKTFIAAWARTVLGAVTRPLMVCVLQVMRPGQDERGAYFSWTPEMLVFNTIDRQGNHRLEPLPGLEAIAECALAECGLLDFKPEPQPLPAGFAPDTSGRATSLRAVFMTVASAHGARKGAGAGLAAQRGAAMAHGAAGRGRQRDNAPHGGRLRGGLAQPAHCRPACRHPGRRAASGRSYTGGARSRCRLNASG